MDRLLLDVLENQFPDSSRTTLRKMLQSGRVRINGTIEKDAKRPVGSADRVEVASRSAVQYIDSRVVILYRDDSLVVVDKSAGLLTVASPTEDKETVEAFLNTHFEGSATSPRVHVVHRLDRDTSGVLVFARNTDVLDRLKSLFETHDIERRYVAIVRGSLPRPAGSFRSFLMEDKALRVRSVPGGAGGKEAITHYEMVSSGPVYSMLEMRLETGRRNQIRVHLAEAGYPIVGDRMYGDRAEDPIERLALHAKTLGFVHPVTRKPMRFEAPVPKEFAGLLR